MASPPLGKAVPYRRRLPSHTPRPNTVPRAAMGWRQIHVRHSRLARTVSFNSSAVPTSSSRVRLMLARRTLLSHSAGSMDTPYLPSHLAG